ncbi:hypothetical protein ACFL0B_07565 [Thermodesulfobacteriota bacterium]
MKKLFLMLCISIFSASLILSCGGGGGGDGGGYVEYDMWDYIVSDTTITKNFDLFETDSNYNPISGPEENAGQVIETVIPPDTVEYEEIVNGTVINTETLIVSSNQIQVVNGNTLERYRTINSSLGDYCIFENHYEHYSPVSGYDFYDVIQVKCDSYSEFYANGIGLVVGQNHNTFIVGQNITENYSIGVANLQ